MGQSSWGRPAVSRVEFDRPCEVAPRFRYRVAVSVKLRAGRVNRQARQIVWATNELVYARALAARINALAGCERAWVEAWNRAHVAAQSRWVRLRG